jgi:hypothetical protein
MAPKPGVDALLKLFQVRNAIIIFWIKFYSKFI